MQRRISLTGLVLNVVCISLFCFSSSYAGDATTYKMTVQTVQLKTSAGNWVTIASPNQEIDIASVSGGAAAGSFFNDAAIPVGSYVNFKLILSETMKFSGSDQGHNTTAGGTITLTGTDANAASTATWQGVLPNANLVEGNETCDGTAGETTVTLNLDAGDADNYIEVSAGTDSATPITVAQSSEISMFFDFDTQDTIHYQNAGGNDIMFYTPPGAGTQFGITVDGTTLTITEADMEIYF